MSEPTAVPMADRALGRVMYAFFRRLVRTLGALWWRLTVDGLERLPEGPFVLAPVHRSYIDTPLMCVVPRRMRFMGKAEVWKYPLLNGWLSTMGAFPVERGSVDRDALHMAIGAIEGGEPVVLFPEGTRRDGPTLYPFFDGPAYVAAKTQVPIVPVGIGGSARSMPRKAKFIRPTKIHLIIGEPLPPPELKPSGRVSRSSVAERTDQLAVVIQRLFDEAQVVAGTPNRPVDASSSSSAA